MSTSIIPGRLGTETLKFHRPAIFPREVAVHVCTVPKHVNARTGRPALGRKREQSREDDEKKV
jgi:hypothetical protein